MSGRSEGLRIRMSMVGELMCGGVERGKGKAYGGVKLYQIVICARPCRKSSLGDDVRLRELRS